MSEIQDALKELFSNMSEPRQTVTVDGIPREWIGLLQLRGDKLEELSYPWYQRQRYDGSEYFRFVCRGLATERYPVAAMGIFETQTGGRTQPIICYLHAPGADFAIRGGDDIKVEVGMVLRRMMLRRL